ncbi:uncharacterized protein BT62DRAFT_879078 [Guyanagaster necrorhizus]|uniref:M-phase inducer phosphatase n=1 Tax=Guyanagaster necrorhizus TaxID=856835 RepID=A0A9P7W3D9_9AGAR|nr:uncharacterized protein BT62DRAFT_879078 [Guyanagaster necrorhizus MCA 3950]KAG7452671.1 hypothetical protein BT62DRAFT_879078 [Guyanagaster necrorhizus MCA 3950]
MTSLFLNVPSTFSRNRINATPERHGDDDDYLSSDLELSFASTVSLNSPPKEPVALTPESDYGVPMDISPAPPKFQPTKAATRPRAFTSAASSRVFGSDVSNHSSSQRGVSGSTHSGLKRTQRSALPMEWLMASPIKDTSTSNHDSTFLSTLEPASPMDVDSSFAEVDNPVTSSPLASSATITSFNSLFYENASPGATCFESPTIRLPKKRRSFSPLTGTSEREAASSSPGLPSSPSDRKLGRIVSGPVLFGGSKSSFSGISPPPVNALKRPRRPALSAIVHPSQANASSVYPLLSPDEHSNEDKSEKQLPPARRAFSAMVPPSVLVDFSDESFDGLDGSSPAQAYAQRQQVKTIRHCDGTDDFRPLTGATALVMQESPSAKFMCSGMPGFGDNELMGKVLPCHRVSEDGLMRITVDTLDDLLDGVYDSQIRDFRIIDCRFDYEYQGGHVPGAINVNTTSAVEEHLLGPIIMKPKPSVSGDSTAKTILVFHCEFSAKRAPTFAKHLRSKDRSMNHHVYPKVHYPEVYILEGGYFKYFQTSRCRPSGYTPMDDPSHATSRREDLDQFRKAKFGRHKSYAYGDGNNRMSSSGLSMLVPKRNTAPSGGNTHVFAAATVARSRRGGASATLTTLAEDSMATADGNDTDTDIGDSPCPPPPTKGKKGRGSLSRADTYGPSRLPF